MKCFNFELLAVHIVNDFQEQRLRQERLRRAETEEETLERLEV